MPRRTPHVVIQAVALTVLCPHCGEPQPSPGEGSDMWEPSQVRALDGTKRDCTSCDKPMLVVSVGKATVGA